VVRSASGNAELYATTSDGSTGETATLLEANLALNDYIEFVVKVNSTSSVDFYYRKNGGASSTVTNIGTKIPTSVANIQFAISNANNASQTQYYSGGLTLTR